MANDRAIAQALGELRANATVSRDVFRAFGWIERRAAELDATPPAGAGEAVEYEVVSLHAEFPACAVVPVAAPGTKLYAAPPLPEAVRELLSERASQLERYSDGGQHRRIAGPDAGLAWEIAQDIRAALRAIGGG